MIQSPARSSTTSRGGVESASATVDDAKVSGGIGYTDPDQLLITVEDDTTVDPAIIELEDSVEYTFKIVDAEHPEGVVFAGTAYLDMKSDRGIVWNSRTDDDYNYVVTYKDGSNTFSSFHFELDEINDEWVSHPNYPVSFYQLGDVHKIANDYLPNIPERVQATLTESNGNYSCDMSVTELIARYRRGDIVELLLYRAVNKDAICKLSCASTGDAFLKTVIFNGNDRYQGVTYSVIVIGSYDPDRHRTSWEVNAIPVDQTQSLFIHFILDKGSGTWSCDTDYQVINAAILAGYSVRGDANGAIVEYIPMGETIDTELKFGYFSADAGALKIYYWVLDSSNNVVAHTIP